MNKSVRFTLLVVAVLAAYVLSACGAPAPVAAPSAQQPSSNPAADAPQVLAVEVAFSGTVESMNGNQWIVDGKTVTVEPQALAGDNIQVGDMVKVEATVGKDGAIITTRVRNSLALSAGAPAASGMGYPDPTQTPPPANGGEQEIFGVIEAMTDDTITIDGVVYQLTNFSEVKDLLSVGDEVKIHFVANPDGTLTIREIELRSSNGDDDANDNGNVNDNGNANDDDGNSNGNANDNANLNDNEANDNGDDNGNANLNDNDSDDNGNDDQGGSDDNGNDNDDDNDNGDDNGNDNGG